MQTDHQHGGDIQPAGDRLVSILDNKRVVTNSICDMVTRNVVIAFFSRAL